MYNKTGVLADSVQALCASHKAQANFIKAEDTSTISALVFLMSNLRLITNAGHCFCRLFRHFYIFQRG